MTLRKHPAVPDGGDTRKLRAENKIECRLHILCSLSNVAD